MNKFFKQLNTMVTTFLFMSSRPLVVKRGGVIGAKLTEAEAALCFSTISRNHVDSTKIRTSHNGRIHNIRSMSSGNCSNSPLTSLNFSSTFQNCKTNHGSRLYSSSNPRNNIDISKMKGNNNNNAVSSSSLLDPSQLFDGTIPYPTSLSPSSAAEFRACPQNYLFTYLYKMKQPTNTALAKGSMCHKALEEVFNLKPEERTLENLQNLLRRSWSEVRLGDEYRHLFELPPSSAAVETVDHGQDAGMEVEEYANQENQEEKVRVPERDVVAEREWGKSALQLLENYFQLENPRLVAPPNPLEREVWVRADLSVNSSMGVTGYAGRSTSGEGPTTNANDDSDSVENDTFLVRGIVDRIDFVGTHPRDDDDKDGRIPEIVLRIIDYKTGKAPNFKYSRATNERIAEDNMWQLKIYALLLREMLSTGKGYSLSYGNLRKVSNIPLRFLRLLYLTSEKDTAQYLEMDLGETAEERDAILQQVHKDLADIWTDILMLVKKQDPKAFVHCDRPWCNCHKVRGNFLKGSVWERVDGDDEITSVNTSS